MQLYAHHRPLQAIRLRSAVLIIFLCSMLMQHVGHAASAEAATDQVRARLIASVTAVYPGEEITLGVHQRIIPHWHTYWQNPGDSGLPTKIKWGLPTGASASDIQWPIPNHYTLGPVTNYGYENEVTLLSTIKVPKDNNGANTFPITATVEWLVCQEVCIPQQVQLALTLPIVQRDKLSARQFTRAVTDPAISHLIEEARANLPVPSPWSASIQKHQTTLILRVADLGLLSNRITDIWFYPKTWGKISHNAPQPYRAEGKEIVIDLQRGDAPPAVSDTLDGVLVITENTGEKSIRRGFDIHTTVTEMVNAGAGPATSVISGTTANTPSQPGIAYALLLAFLGGVILNLMPCVFPVLSIKALSLLEHTQYTSVQTRLQGIAYTSGVLASFALLAALLIALRAAGTQIGWGFQYQSPLFVLVVAYIMFAVGLSLSGVFFIGGSITGIGASLADRRGYSGSFFTGVLAAIVATPCTAPFMGAAISYALARPAPHLLAVFISMGLGLALPYLLLSTWPRLQRALPKPGLWMERVKQGLAFPMYLAAVWLVWVLVQQAGANAIAIALGGMVLIAFAAWLVEITRTSRPTVKRSGVVLAVVALLAALGGGFWGIHSGAGSVKALADTTASHKNWEPYTEERLQALRAVGTPVFLNFTAAWCITCLVNENVALTHQSVIDAFKKTNIIYLKGDWTNQDQRITKILANFNRSGVPLYVFYPKGIDSPPALLPQILTPQIVLNAINGAQ